MKEFILHVIQAENGYVIELSPPYHVSGNIQQRQRWVINEHDKLYEVLAQAILSAKLDDKQLQLFE